MMNVYPDNFSTNLILPLGPDRTLTVFEWFFANPDDPAVSRALDNSSVTPPDEVDRLTRIARAGRIPLQVGTTNGGNDGSELARYGAIDDALGWPLRYSHSPAEVIDLRDIRSLARLIAALASSSR